jgi:hypothetical protein
MGGGALTDNTNPSYVGSATVSGTESTVQIPLPPGYSTITDLQVFVATAPGTGTSWTITVDKNGSASALSCSVAGTGQTCSDSSLVAVTAGDLIDLKVTPFTSPALTTITWTAKLLP